MDNNIPVDVGLEFAMDTVYNMIKASPENTDSDDQLRLRIASHNLKALANIILIADEKEDIDLDLKQLALGILGTSSWMSQDLSDLDESSRPS